jgi:O-antigen ligase
MRKDNSRSRFTPRNILLGFVVSACIFMVTNRIIGTNTTGTGRLENYRDTISGIRENLLLGQGPSLFSINVTENTYLTLLSYYGLIGLALLLAIVFATTLSLMKTPRNERHSFHITVAIFLVASAGESLLTGGSRDTGLFYLLVLLALTRGQPSRKYLPQP